MMVKRKIPLITTALILLCICFSGCKSDSRSNTDGQGSSGSTLISAVSGEITLNGSSISAGSGVSVDGTTATITKAGTYEITGSLEDGQILVDASGEVTIILNNADITCSTSSPIYVKEAKKVVITLADGSVNSITDGLIAIDTSNNGVKSDGLIDIQGGTVEIQAGDDGLICNEQNISDAASVTVNGEIISAT